MTPVKSQAPRVSDAVNRVDDGPERRVPRGVGLLVGAGASLVLWVLIIAGVRALMR